MITKTTGYQVGDNDKIHATVEEAQVSEVSRIFGECNGSGACESERIQEIASDLVHKYKQEIIDILTTGPKSKPKARAINGGKKTRKFKFQEGAYPVSSGNKIASADDGFVESK